MMRPFYKELWHRSMYLITLEAQGLTGRGCESMGVSYRTHGSVLCHVVLTSAAALPCTGFPYPENVLYEHVNKRTIEIQ